MRRQFDQAASDVLGGPLACEDITTLQVNLGMLCNQQCAHCHLRAGPNRTERMSTETVDDVVRALRRLGGPVLDITGGAPELNPHLPRLIREGREAGCPVMIRTNLTALTQSEHDGLPGLLAGHQVTVVASMPCYLEENVERQRGPGVYDSSIAALQHLNQLGYAVDPALELNLVYNPCGPALPPPQAELAEDYRRHLGEEFGVRFDRLFLITNMPIGRFAECLAVDGGLEDYVHLLRESFNPATVEGLMCRHQISVGPDGTLYDCDFNLALGLPADVAACRHVRSLDPERLAGRTIVTAEHCFGCTAGAGSSCTGVLAAST